MDFKTYLKESTINLDKGDDPADIKDGNIVIYKKIKYTCIDTMGDNYTFILKDNKRNTYLYDAASDTIEKY